MVARVILSGAKDLANQYSAPKRIYDGATWSPRTPTCD